MASTCTCALLLAVALVETGCADLIGVDDWKPGGSSAASGGGAGAAGGGPGATTTGATTSSGTGGSRSYVDAVQQDMPVAYWRLGESSGTTVADSIGLLNGTLTDTIGLGAPGGIMGDSNTAISIPASNASVAIGDDLDFPDNASFSIEAWVYTLDLDSTYRAIVYKGNTAGPGDREGYTLASSSNSVVFERWILTSGNPDHAGGQPLDIGVYSHVVGTYDASRSTISLYVNGALVDSHSATLSLADNDDSLTLGAAPDNSHCLNGLLDEVAIYDKALSAARVKAHYDAAVR